MLRKALPKDVRRIHELINASASKGEMLARSLSEIYENVRDFFVYEEDGRIIGTCAVHVFWGDLAEIRSLCVEEPFRGRGIGGQLVSACIEEARSLGIDRLFLLTYMSDFFSQFGFRIVDREELPQKIWTDCVRCPKYPACDEVAMVRRIGGE
jgi:amino-acid N-acetyltransferase